MSNFDRCCIPLQQAQFLVIIIKALSLKDLKNTVIVLSKLKKNFKNNHAARICIMNKTHI